MIVRRTTSAVSSSPQKFIDNFPFPLLRRAPHSKALVPRNAGCPLSLKLIIMASATRSHSPFGLYVWVPYHFFSDPGSRNDQCPCANLLACSATVFWIRNTQFFLSPFLHTMSLYIDMKMIRPGNRSGSHSIWVIMFWISARNCNVENPAKFFHFGFLSACNSCICEVIFCIVSWLSLYFRTEISSTRNSWALFNSPTSWTLLIWVSRSAFSFMTNSSWSRNMLFSRLYVSEMGDLQFQSLSTSLLLKFTNASVKRFHFCMPASWVQISLQQASDLCFHQEEISQHLPG